MLMPPVGFISLYFGMSGGADNFDYVSCTLKRLLPLSF